MKLAAVQMVSTADLNTNLQAARRLIAEAASQGARLIGLPEYFCYMGMNEFDKLPLAESPTRPGEVPAADAVVQRMLSDAAREHGVWLLGGTLPLRTPGGERVFNTLCAFAPDGRLAARYDKVHLFRFANGREDHDEGRVVQAGGLPQALTVADGTSTARVGLSVCYDLRFPELYRSLMAPACDLIAVPSAFTHTTGQAHWELLLRARAVENQCYVMAPAQGGSHQNGRRTWGHTMVVDPWGEVLAVLPDGEGVVMAELDLARLAAVRRKLPALEHRRL